MKRSCNYYFPRDLFIITSSKFWPAFLIWGKLLMWEFRKFIFFLVGCSANALAQSSYPVIDNKTQEARDQERHLILNTELLAEYQEFWKTTGALAASPTPELAAKAHRHDENIKALQRELRSADAGRKPPNAPLRVVVRAERQAGPRGGAGAATYWNPYNRATNDRSPNVSSTTLRRDAP
ncbi:MULTISPECIES: hypothetical protein [Massilia]|uniref:hypothetical protein n=1 Tax=Massilia TaxID=149698 RepID=UPI00115FE6DA|nr:MULTISPECIES: hypothetical protein [Massilia]